MFEDYGEISYASLKNSKRKKFNKNKVDESDRCLLIYYDSGLHIDEAVVTPRKGEFSDDEHCEEYWQYISETKHDAIAEWGYTIFSNRDELQELSEKLSDFVGIGQLNSHQIKTLVDDFRSGEQMKEVRVTLTVHTGGATVDSKIAAFARDGNYDFEATRKMVDEIATRTNLSDDDVITNLLEGEQIIGVDGRPVLDADIVKLIKVFDEVDQ